MYKYIYTPHKRHYAGCVAVCAAVYVPVCDIVYGAVCVAVCVAVFVAVCANI